MANATFDKMDFMYYNSKRLIDGCHRIWHAKNKGKYKDEINE